MLANYHVRSVILNGASKPTLSGDGGVEFEATTPRRGHREAVEAIFYLIELSWT